MKKYLMIFMALVIGASGAMAGQNLFEGMTKDQLANYEITITDKRSGKVVGKMSRAEYKVVRIDSGRDAETEVILRGAKQYATDLKRVADAKKEVLDAYSKGYNSVILHAGVGKDGLKDKNNGSAFEVKERDNGIAGATYCRSKESTGLCGSAFTNKTFLLGVKLDF
jgi:hypothetical protein